MNNNESTSKKLFHDTNDPIPAVNANAVDNQSSTDKNLLEALSLSLKKGFRIVGFLLLVLSVFFIFSNIFWVEEGNIAIQTRFGRVIKRNGHIAISPGGPYFALPAPMDRVIYIPTTMQKVAINKAFWLKSAPDVYTKLTTHNQPSDDRDEFWALKPGIDGSLITADKNIVQGQWSVDFQLDFNTSSSSGDFAPEYFINNVGNMQNARNLVRNIMEEAIVKTVAQLTVADFVMGKINNALIQRYAMKKLTGLKTGIKIVQISPERYTVPRVLMGAFQEVNQSQSEKASAIEAAKRYRAKVLNETAGADFPTIIAAINSYEIESRSHLPEAKHKKEQALSNLSKVLRSAKVGGLVAEQINNAKAYKTQTVELVKSSSNRFQQLLPQFTENPKIMQDRLMQDTFQKIFSGNVKTFYLPQDKKKTIYIEVNGEL